MKRSLGAIAVIAFLLFISGNGASAVAWSATAARQGAGPAGVQTIGEGNPGGDAAHRSVDTGHKVFLPFVTNYNCNGLYGTVTDRGARAAGVPLDLRFFNGTAWSTVTTRSTDATGWFCFTSPANLQAGQKYYVRYGPQNTIPSRVSSWLTRAISSYTAGMQVDIGDFDLADITLQSPMSGAKLSLPQQFTWNMRAGMSLDNYEFNLFDPANPSVINSSAPLGTINSYTLSTLPAPFRANVPYGWYVGVYGPDNGYGVSYYYRSITFLNTGAGAGTLGPSIQDPARDRYSVPLTSEDR